MSRGLAWWVGIVSLMAGTVLGVASADAQESGKKYALLIGVEGYDPAQLTKLEYAEDDVIELGKALEGLGFTVIVMTSKSDIPARRPSTAKKIHDQFDGLLKRVQSEQDMLVVVLSGHGLQYRDDPVDDEGAKETYFCPEEAVPKDRDSLVPISPLSKKLAGSKALKRLLVVDACRNEVASKLNKAVEETLDPVGRRARTEQRGMLTLFSCAPKEKSWEHPDVGHGVFTNYLLKYLKGEAEPQLYPRDECRIQQLAAYTSRETSDFVFRRLNQDQSPDLVGRSNDWSFGKRGGSKEFKASPLAFPFTVAQATAAQQAWAKSLGKKVVETNSLGMELVLIPPGTFRMGSPASEQDRNSNETQVDVTLTEPIWVGKTEVTQGQWQQVMGTTPWKGEEYVKEGLDYAANYVSWNDAQEFVKKLSQRDGGTYRLTTEAEWEWSCRAGTSSRWSFGENEADLTRYGWYGGGNPKAEPYAHQVGLKLANPFGLHDMHGNVGEWCEDVKINKLPGGTNPKVTTGGVYRVLRGGSWYADPLITRSAGRNGDSLVSRHFTFGFRLARTR